MSRSIMEIRLNENTDCRSLGPRSSFFEKEESTLVFRNGLAVLLEKEEIPCRPEIVACRFSRCLPWRRDARRRASGFTTARTRRRYAHTRSRHRRFRDDLRRKIPRRRSILKPIERTETGRKGNIRSTTARTPQTIQQSQTNGVACQSGSPVY